MCISTQLTDEPPAAAFGDGTGLLAVARTSTGCVLGGAAVGERGRQAQQVGAQAAESLVRDIRAGGCVDQWWVAEWHAALRPCSDALQLLQQVMFREHGGLGDHVINVSCRGMRATMQTRDE